MKTPVLFIIFNRPDTTKKVFKSIKNAKPERIYIASDGPRSTHKEDLLKITETRNYVLKNIDWPCKVKTSFQKNNLGCGQNVSRAISWFFMQEKEGIILEDDCLPHPSFFPYCELLLDRYRDKPEVMHISGDQFAPSDYCKHSYYFAQIMHCWGWASWADRWQKYDFGLKNVEASDIKKSLKNKEVRNFWLDIYEKMRKSEIDTWDYQWALIIISKRGLCINPRFNLISNIGFDKRATHTKTTNEYANMSRFNLKIIKHPSKVELNQKCVEYIYQHHFGINMHTKNTFDKIIDSLKQYIYQILS